MTNEQRAAAQAVTAELRRRYPRWGFKWATGLPQADDPRLAVQSDWVLAATLALILEPLLKGGPASDPAALPIDQAPRDGTLLRLLVDYSEEANAAEIAELSAKHVLWPHTAFEDTDAQAWTVGFNSLDNTGEDEWQFVGWNWSQDCFTEGHGKVIGWLPFHTAAAVEISRMEAEVAQLRDHVSAAAAQFRIYADHHNAEAAGFEKSRSKDYPAAASRWEQPMAEALEKARVNTELAERLEASIKAGEQP